MSTVLFFKISVEVAKDIMILVGKGKRLLELEAKQLILCTTVTIMQFKFIYLGVFCHLAL
jgi:hypothetical protein